MKYKKQDIEFDVSYDYYNKEDVILIDLGDKDSIYLYRDQLLAMLEELNKAEDSR